MAVTSTEDGSVVIGVDINVSDAEKELARLKKSIAKLEKDIETATEKREKAQKESIFKAGVLDAEKAKLQEIKDRLADLQAMSKDKAINFEKREEYKALIPDVKAELADQKTRVNALQAEWNKIDASVQRYEEKINDSTAQLTAQKAQAGDLQQQIDEANNAVSEMAVADQRIVDLNRELLELKQRQKELEKLGVGFGYEEYDQNAARIAEITNELKNYEKALKDVHAEEAQDEKSATGGTTGREEAQARLNAYLEKSSSLYKKLSEAIGKTSEISSVLQDVAQVSGGRLAGALQKAGEAAEMFGTKLSGALTAAGPYVAIAGAVAGALSKIVSAASKFGTQVADSLASGVKGFANLLKLVSEFSVKTIEFFGKFNVFSRLTDGLTKKFSRLGQMIRRVFVFSVITSGLRAIRTQLSGYLKVNAEFTNALRRLQGVFLTAFQPIYDVVVPALTTLINVLAKAAAVVTQFFAALFGTTAKQAQTNAKDLYEQANATTAAGEAAKEASKQLAAFDEINKLEGTKSSGGGAAAVDTGPLFDYEYDETPFDSWGEAFSAFLDKLLAGIPKLRDAFKNFADWLNDLAKKLYDMFTFPGVLDKVKQLGRELAEALNDLVNWIDWEMLGRALGAGLNLALNFLTSFLYTFDWINLGRKLADFINGLVDEIDWYEFGRLLWAGWKIALETLAGFILNLNMPLMAHAATQTVLGFFDEMKNTIDRIDWSEIGAQIGRFLTNIKWADIFRSVEKAIAAGLMAVFSTLRGLIDQISPNIREFAQSIVNALKDFFATDVDWKMIARTIADGIKTALALISGLLDPQLFYAIGKAIGDFLVGLDWPGLVGGLTEVLARAIASAVAAVTGFLDAVEPNLKEIARGIAQKINEFVASVDWKELGHTISRGIKAALDFLIELIENINWVKVGAAIGDVLSRIDWFGILAKVCRLVVDAIFAGILALIRAAPDFILIGLEIVAGLLAGIANAVVGIVTQLYNSLVKPIVDGVKSLFGIHSPSTVFEEIGENLVAGLLQGISNTWNSITEFFSTALDSLKQFFSDTWESIKTTASAAWETIKTTLSQTWDSLKEAASTAFTAIKDKISETWDNIQQKTSEIWNNIKAALTEAWENLKNAAQEKFEAIKKKISEVWDNVKQKTTEIWNNIKSTLTSVWDNLKSAATQKFQEIKTKISEAWENVKTATQSAWESVKSTVSNALSSIWSNVTSKFSEIVSAARKWGSDICDSISSGISGAMSKVTNAARGVANGIKDFLGFSEPKKGPLSDFHTYMPDMLQLMSDGINGNAHLATNAASDLAKSIADSFNQPYTLGNVRMGKMPDISTYNIPAIARGEVIPTNREFTEVINREYRDSASTGADIESAVARAMRSAGMMGGGNITVVMEIDGREFGRASYKYGTQEQQRVGVRLTEAR